MRNPNYPTSRKTFGYRSQSLTAAAAAGSLGKKLSTNDAASVIRLLKSADPQAREKAIQTLAKYGQKEIIPHIARCLRDPDIKIRVEACRALGDMRAHNCKSKLYDALQDKDPYVVCAAAGALSRMGDKQGLEPIAKLVIKNGTYRSEAIRTLNLLTGQDFRANEHGIKEAIRWIKFNKSRFFK